MSSATFLPVLLLSIAAPIGAFDVLYFHIWKLRLHARPESRVETVTHVARGLLVGAIALVLSRWEPRGAWFVGVVVLAGLDFVNNVLDVWVEPASRRSLGGLPRVESVIHIVGATAGGAAVAALVLAGWPLASMPTELAPSTLPMWLSANGHLLAVGGIAIAVLEAVLLIRAAARGSSGSRAIATA